VATLRRTGAGLLAERLEAREGGPWQALFAFLLLGRLEALAGADPAAAPGPVSTGAGGMVGESPALHAALERLSRLAPRDLTVLVLGETGTGKELAARLVHRGSPRARGPFVAVNCAALGESLLLSDLFGHVRGAFTGADRDRAGVFETAQRGTVFLDEIGDLPAVAQGMLLRVLQEGEVRRVGESLPRRVDVRVVAATHRDLAAAVAASSFREDLFYRLKVGSVLLPPLRERGADVLLLAEHFLARERGPGFVPRLSRPARERLLSHRFPGNIRELENVLKVAAALASGGTIEPEHLGLPDPAASEPGSYHRRVEEFRRRQVIEALAAAAGNQAEAARGLGLSRQALSYLVRQFRLP
jgi:transcriptional regulator with GAF, ATPase, and Fis domain